MFVCQRYAAAATLKFGFYCGHITLKAPVECTQPDAHAMHCSLQSLLQGKKRAVVLALDIMCDAVDRYKELCEGRYCGGHLQMHIFFVFLHTWRLWYAP